MFLSSYVLMCIIHSPFDLNEQFENSNFICIVKLSYADFLIIDRLQLKSNQRFI